MPWPATTPDPPARTIGCAPRKSNRATPNIGTSWGRFRQLDFDHTDLPLALTYYRRAVELNPYSPFYKLDLAGTLEMSGQYAEADKYFRAAQHDYPISPEVSWKYGNFLLRQQRLPEAYAEIHRAVMVDPKLIPSGRFARMAQRSGCSRSAGSNSARYASRRLGSDRFFIRFAGAHGRTGGLEPPDRKKAGRWNGKPCFRSSTCWSPRSATMKPEQVWRQATSLRGRFRARAGDARSLVFDGGFEKDLSGGGFGWQEMDVSGADFDFDTDVKHSGERSARIVFRRNSRI